MSDPDNVARLIAGISAATAIGSLAVSALTYRRGRPKIGFNSETQAVITNTTPGEEASVFIIGAMLVNTSQVKAHFLRDEETGAPMVTINFHPSRLQRLPRHSHSVQWNLDTLKADNNGHDHPTPLPATLEPFSGTEARGAIPYQTLADLPPDLTRLRLEIQLSTGKTIHSRWMRRISEHPLPTGPHQVAISIFGKHWTKPNPAPNTGSKTSTANG